MDENPFVVRMPLWKAYVILVAFMVGSTLVGAGLAAALIHFFPSIFP